MRWKGVIFLVVVFAIIIVLSFIFTDVWLESQLEQTASGLNGAKVEIDNLDFSIFGPKLNWDRIQITDPKNTMKNMVESGFCEFKMEFFPLLSKKVIIENIQLSGLKTNTDRETDGAISKEERIVISQPNYVKETVNKLKKRVEETPTFQLARQVKSANVDSILSILNITSVKKIDSLQKELTGKYDTWYKEFTNLDYDKDLKAIEQKVKSFDVNKLKGIEDYRNALNNVEQINATINSVNKDFQNKKNSLQNDLSNLKSGISVVDNWVAADYKKALSMAKLPEINTKNIGEMIFGQNVLGQFNQYLGYVAEARNYANKLKSDKPEKQKPPRLKGQDIYFYNKYARPNFWIQKIDLSGQTENGINLSGLVKNIVSDQRQIGATTEIDIKGAGEKGAKVELTGSLNYLEEVPKENFNVSYAGFSLANTKISESKFLPSKVQKGLGSVESTVNLSGDNIEGKVKFVGQKLQFDLSNQPKPKNKLDEIIQSIVKSIDMLDVIMVISGKGSDLKFRINSNLDDLFVKKMKAILGDEIAAAKKKLQEKIDKEVIKYKTQLTGMIAEKENMIRSEIKKYEDMIDEQKQAIESKKKEIEDKIKKEQGKQVDKAKDKVKDLLKF
jgi:uncharacterized protein (TIGR03545 family)